MVKSAPSHPQQARHGGQGQQPQPQGNPGGAQHQVLEAVIQVHIMAEQPVWQHHHQLRRGRLPRRCELQQ